MRRKSQQNKTSASAATGASGEPHTRKKNENTATPFTGGTSSEFWEFVVADRAMDQFEEQAKEVVSRLQSKQLFQSDWDIASFVMFFIFIGTVLLLVVLVLIRCCCCGCWNEKPRKIGIDNFGMEP
ncbi:small integral membrane protein 22 [Antennarius striatus]|uniref:small integral membrane protein 22 n=1 Tax=Antennarius striatus TaxID=241820 RepID=UPI0035AEBDA9